MATFTSLTASFADRYRIERELGAGGMATVYLAHDVKHDRKVAIKVLKPELAAVLGADRFVVEIKTTAALQHPHILPLFDSGTADGLLYYVMPYVEGETIREKLNRETQFGVDEAIRITREVADALEYAHRRGVIHRDIKPENILLHDGRAMVMDFGIALAVSAAAGGRMTETGLSLGTPHYMSPEQATAEKDITPRSDIYSLASVLYEMLTGEPPHSGGSAQQVIMKIIAEPVKPAASLRKSVPAHVSAALDTALEKLAADRFEHAKAFSDALVNPGFATPRTSATSAVRPRSVASLKWVAVAMSLVAVGAIGVAVWALRRSTPIPVTAQFEIGLPDSVNLARTGGARVALSRDGSKLVIVGDKRGEIGLYVRRMDTPAAVLVRGTVGDLNPFGASPVFSPDGEWIVFRSRDAIKKIPVDGGTPQTIGPDAFAPAMGERGTLVLEITGKGIGVGSVNGGPVRMVTKPNPAPGIQWLAHPDVLPGDEYALVTVIHTGAAVSDYQLGVVSLKDGSIAELGITGSNPRYVASGHIVFARAGNLVYTIPFSPRKRAVTGRESLLHGEVWLGSGGVSAFAVSDNGTFVYALNASIEFRRLVTVDLAGLARDVPGPGRNYIEPRLSPNGRQILTGLAASIETGVWVVDVATGAIERLAADREGRRAEWSRDGTRAWFIRDSGTTRWVVSRAVDRSAADQVMFRQGEQTLGEIAIGPAHGFAALRVFKNATNRDIYIAPMDSLSAARPFVATPSDEIEATISGDGRLLAYASNETGHFEIYVQPIPGPGPRVKVSVDGGTEPVWSPSGHTLFYRGIGRIMSADLGDAPLGVARRATLFADTFTPGVGHTTWGVFPDGRQFLFVRDVEKDDRLFAIVNWPQLKSTGRNTAVDR